MGSSLLLYVVVVAAAAAAGGVAAHPSGGVPPAFDAAAAAPWRAWLPARSDSPWAGGGAGAGAGAAGRDMEVGVAIGVPNPATGGAASAPAVSVFGTPGWYPIPAQPVQTPGLGSTILQGLPVQQPIQTPLQTAYPQTFHLTPVVQPINTFQPSQAISSSQPIQTFQPVQYGSQPLSFDYKVGEAPLVVREWEEPPAAAATAAPPPLLRAPWTSGGREGGAALLAPTPFVQRRVGAFRLRSDRGYQLLMEVPPVMAAAPGAPADGVLVMEMRSTLYRPLS